MESGANWIPIKNFTSRQRSRLFQFNNDDLNKLDAGNAFSIPSLTFLITIVSTFLCCLIYLTMRAYENIAKLGPDVENIIEMSNEEASSLRRRVQFEKMILADDQFEEKPQYLVYETHSSPVNCSELESAGHMTDSGGTSGMDFAHCGTFVGCVCPKQTIKRFVSLANEQIHSSDRLENGTEQDSIMMHTDQIQFHPNVAHQLIRHDNDGALEQLELLTNVYPNEQQQQQQQQFDCSSRIETAPQFERQQINVVENPLPNLEQALPQVTTPKMDKHETFM